MDPSHSYVLVGESSPWIYCRTGDVRGLCFTRSRSSDSSLPPTRRACAIEKGCSMVGHYTPVDPDKSVGLANLCCYRTTRQNRSNSQSLGVGVGRVATYSRRALKNVCMAQPGKHFVLADFAGCAGRCVRTYKKAVCGFCPSGERGLCGGSCNSDGSVLCDAYRRRRRSDPGRDDDIHFEKAPIRSEIRARYTAITAGAVIVLAALFAGVRGADLVTDRASLSAPFAFFIFQAGESPWQPKQAAAFVLRERLPRNLFHDFNSGGFVVWNMWPAYRDYIDGRSVPFGGGLLLRNGSLSEQPFDSESWTKEADTAESTHCCYRWIMRPGTHCGVPGNYWEPKNGARSSSILLGRFF